MRGMRKQREKVLGLERARRHPFDVIIAQLSVSLSLSLPALFLLPPRRRKTQSAQPNIIHTSLYFTYTIVYKISTIIF